MKKPKPPKQPHHAPKHPAQKKHGLHVTNVGTPHHPMHPPKPVPHGHGKKPKHPAKPKKPKHPHHKRRQFSPGSDVACCVAEAFGTLVEASGASWSAEQTLTLYRRTAGTPDTGASILATLTAAGADFREVEPDGWRRRLILGVALPEPHAIAVVDGRWWSWGEPFNPADWPELVIEESWAVLL